MCDSELAQEPLLVLPGDEQQQIHRFWKSAAVHPGDLVELDPQRKEELMELATAFSAYPQFTRAAEYYKSLAGQAHRPRHAPQQLGFLLAGAVRQRGLVVANLPPREPQPKPHPLRVRFHRT